MSHVEVVRKAFLRWERNPLRGRSDELSAAEPDAALDELMSQAFLDPQAALAAAGLAGA